MLKHISLLLTVFSILFSVESSADLVFDMYKYFNPSVDFKFETAGPATVVIQELCENTPCEEANESNSITTTKAFEITTKPVTQLQWWLIMGDNPSNNNNKNDCPDDWFQVNWISICPNFPVNNTTTFEIEKFLEDRNDSSSEFKYRLANEDEILFAIFYGLLGLPTVIPESTPGLYLIRESKPPKKLGEYFVKPGIPSGFRFPIF